MLDLGTVIPGTTLYIPFHTFSSDDPSASMTITGLATSDIEIYKDGGPTPRASDAGYTLLDTDGIDFDEITGIHGISIDLADNTTANFYEAGSQYWVVISSITLDAATINFVAAKFRIGYPGAILDTTIATLASQTGFTLEDGSADDNAYNGCICVVHDLASAVQVASGVISDYTGGTKTITLGADPGIFTMAAGDNISIFPPSNVHAWNAKPLSTTNPLPDAAADGAGGLPVSDAGGLDLDTILGRITGNVALASVVGALDDAAAAGDPTSADTLMQYTKQLINILIGTDGIATFPAEAAPGNAVSLSEVIRAIHVDVTGLNGDAMRGTDSAALASVCTEGRLAELDAANLPADVDSILADTGTDGVVVAAASKTGYALSAAGVDAIWDENDSIFGIAMRLMASRIYTILNNRMTVNESTGVVTLYEDDDSTTEATGDVDSSAGTTERDQLSWV